MNWEGKVEKINNILKTWKMRQLTCYEKNMYIQCLIFPQLVYLGTAVSMPIRICKALHRTKYTFIWNSKREKVKRNVCIKSEREGGLGMVDLILKANSLRLSWFFLMQMMQCGRHYFRLGLKELAGCRYVYSIIVILNT